MKVRFNFSADIYIEGENMTEVRKKFDSIPLFSQEAYEDGNIEFNELRFVEDAETYEDLTREYYECERTI